MLPPLTMLELTRTARQRSTFAFRMAAPVLCAFVVGIPLVTSARGASIESFGYITGNIALIIQLVAIYIAGPLFASETIAAEKENRTLPLLELASTGSADLLLSKWLVAFLRTEMMVISCLPVQAISALCGGIDLAGITNQFVIATLACVATTSLGLMVSVEKERATEAFVWTLAVCGFSTFIVALLWLSYASSATGSIPTFDPLLSMLAMRKGLSIIYALPCVGLLAALAGFFFWCASRSMANQGGETRKPALPILTPPSAIHRERRTVQENPTDRLKVLVVRPTGQLYAAILQGQSGRVPESGWYAALFLVSILMSIIPFNPFSWLFPVIAVQMINGEVARMRASGAMALVSLTPEDDARLADDMARAHLERLLILAPSLFIGSFVTMILVLSVAEPTSGAESLLVLAVLALDLIAVPAYIACMVSVSLLVATSSLPPALRRLVGIVSTYGLIFLVGVTIWMTLVWPLSRIFGLSLMIDADSFALLAFKADWAISCACVAAVCRIGFHRNVANVFRGGG